MDLGIAVEERREERACPCGSQAHCGVFVVCGSERTGEGEAISAP